MNLTEIRSQLPNLDPASRRKLIEANLNKLAPVKPVLYKFRFETFLGAAPGHGDRDSYQQGHTATVSTCLACWEWRLKRYKEVN